MNKYCLVLVLAATNFSFILSFRGSKVDLYDYESCKDFWNATADSLLQTTRNTSRQDFGKMQIEKIGHTPMWLRIQANKLHCVVHPSFQVKRYRMKIYRAAHYISRLNRLLRQSKLKVADGTEWWTHHSDWTKVRAGEIKIPVFSVSGGTGFTDIAGIPFMSFSDKISQLENTAFHQEEKNNGFPSNWDHRKGAAFFHGTLSDCAKAVNQHDGDVKFCARAKVVYYAMKLQHRLLSGISTTSNFEGIGLDKSCDKCRSHRLDGNGFVRSLLEYKYVLDFAGAGNWSRRMSLLLRSGGLIFRSENSGYQFYDTNLKPGVHYIPFNPQIGKAGVGNLLSRLEWAEKNDEIAKRIAKTSQNFGRRCLTESSIDDFVSLLLTKYSKLLRDDPLVYPLVDLSSCISNTRRYYRLSKECEETIKRCWGI